MGGKRGKITGSILMGKKGLPTAERGNERKRIEMRKEKRDDKKNSEKQIKGSKEHD